MLGFKGEGKRRIKSYWQGRKAYHFRLDLKIDGRLMELILITLSYSLLNHLLLSLLHFFQCISPCHLASLYLVSAMCLKVLPFFFKFTITVGFTISLPPKMMQRNSEMHRNRKEHLKYLLKHRGGGFYSLSI